MKSYCKLLEDKKCIIIYGPTASGKSLLADSFGENGHHIVNGDSMQIYKDILIITAQPKQQDGINYELYGFLNCDEDFSVGKWFGLVNNLIKKNQEKIPIIVGGTGMYISCLINGIAEIPEIPKVVQNEIAFDVEKQGLEKIHEKLRCIDPEASAKIFDKQRVIRALSVFLYTGRAISWWQKSKKKILNENEFLKIWISPQRDVLYKNINERCINMIENGAIEEVEKCSKKFSKLPKAIGVREIQQYLNNEISYEEMVMKFQQATRNYGKRQETWFRNQLAKSDVILQHIDDKNKFISDLL